MVKKNIVLYYLKRIINLSISLVFYLYQIIVNVIFYLYNFSKKLIREIFYFLNESLTRNELISLILFVIFFVFSDRFSKKSVKYPKTNAPNVLWRITAFLMYTPIWVEYVLTCFIFIVRNSPSFAELELTTFNHEFIAAVASIFSFQLEVERFFNYRMSFIVVYQVFLYFSIRIFVHLIPTKYFRLPMFMKYHMINGSLLLMLAPILYEMYRYWAGFIPSGYINVEDSVKNYPWAINLSWAWIALCLAVLGRNTWDALRGKSFTKTFLDITLRDHLGAECLYPDEKWSDYGMDDLENEDF